MTEKDREINDLRRENSRLRAELDNLRWTQSRTDKTDLGDAIQTIYECCRDNETCKACPLNNEYGCTITGSPYEWRFPKL